VYIWQAQDNEFVLNFLELMALEHLATIIITIIEQMLSKDLLAFKGMTNILALGVQLTSSFINFLLSSIVFLHLPSASKG